MRGVVPGVVPGVVRGVVRASGCGRPGTTTERWRIERWRSLAVVSDGN